MIQGIWVKSYRDMGYLKNQTVIILIKNTQINGIRDTLIDASALMGF